MYKIFTPQYDTELVQKWFLTQELDNLSNKLSKVVEKGSNTNGKWIKFEDGTMICCKLITGQHVYMTDNWGPIYRSTTTVDGGDMPQTFTELYYSSISISSNDYDAWIIRQTESTTSKFGKIHLACAISYDAYVALNCIAIGRWK